MYGKTMSRKIKDRLYRPEIPKPVYKAPPLVRIEVPIAPLTEKQKNEESLKSIRRKL
jgi:hypothetical protein